jgi:hypothetical protein
MDMRFGAIAIAALTASLSAFAADPFVGTWKPNVEKWKLSPGAPERRKSEVITFESAGKDKYRLTTTTLDGKATDIAPETLIVDGKEQKDDNGVTAKFQRIDSSHVRMTLKSTKGTAVIDWVASPDGKTLTVTRKGTGATSGRPLDEFLVYDKQ